jgi:ABC-type sugar transport system permease subunit
MVPGIAARIRRKREIRIACRLLSPTVLLLLTVLTYPVAWEVWTRFTSFSPLQEAGPAFERRFGSGTRADH